MDNREKDIQALCTAILSLPSNKYDNPNGPYESSCPFCGSEFRKPGIYGNWAEMDELLHSQDCAYTIAKDLSTGYK